MSARKETKRRTALRRNKRRRASKRGVALVMVLGALTVLTVFLTELQEETSSELAAALAERDALRAEYLARSAVNLSRLLIAIEPEVRNSIPLFGAKMPQIPVWEFTDMLLGPFNDKSGSAAFGSLINADISTGKNLGLSGGSFEVTIVDEASKLDVNATDTATSTFRLARQLMGLMGQAQYNPLFEGRDADGQFSDRMAICSAIIDWSDSDTYGNETQYSCDANTSAATTGGVEDNFYQMIGLPYRRKNAPYDSFEELRLVRGMSDDFWATFVDPEPTNPRKRVLTVWGGGQLNANTAEALPLLGVICSDKNVQAFCNDPVQMQSFIFTINMLRSLMRGVPLISTPKQFVDALQGGGQFGSLMTMAGLQPIKFASPKEIERQLTLKSKVFSIYADGIVPGNQRTTKVRVHAVVDFRMVSGLNDPFSMLPGVGAPPVPQGGSTGTGAGTGIQQANPAGTVIYWRVE